MDLVLDLDLDLVLVPFFFAKVGRTLACLDNREAGFSNVPSYHVKHKQQLRLKTPVHLFILSDTKGKEDFKKPNSVKSLEHHWLLSHFLVVGARRGKTDRDQRRTSLRNLFTLPIATSSLSKKANLDLPHSRQTLQNVVLILSLNSLKARQGSLSHGLLIGSLTSQIFPS